MWQAELRRRAEVNHSVINPGLLQGLDVSRSKLYRELAGPNWRRAHRNAWVLHGSADTPHQRAAVALSAAGPGSALSHHSGAALWGLPGYTLRGPTIHVTRVRGSNSTTPEGAVVHRVRRLPADQVTELDSLTVIRPDVILIQLAAVLAPGQVERLMDRMWSRRLISGRSLEATITQMSAKGRTGLGVVRALFDQRGPAWVPPSSGLESRVMTTLEREGLIGFRRQVDVGLTERWVGRVDFVHDATRTIIEVQSDAYHAALSSRRDDEKRIGMLEATGYEVVEVWESDVWYHPDAWIGDVRASLGRHRRSRAA